MNYLCVKCQEPASKPREGEEPLCDHHKYEKRHPSGARRAANLSWAICHMQELLEKKKA